MFLDYTEKQLNFIEHVKRYIDREIVPQLKEYDLNKPLTNRSLKSIYKKVLPLFWNPDDNSGLIDIKNLNFSESNKGGLLGGIQFDTIGLGIIVEEISKINPSLMSAFGMSIAPSGSIFLSKNEAMINKYVFPLLLGDKIGCTAITEPKFGSNSADLDTTAVLNGENWILNGIKTWISNGDISDICILSCKCDEGDGNLYSAQLVVDREISPYKTKSISHMGLKAMPIGSLIFKDVKVPVENKISGKKSKGSEGFKNALKGLEMARSCMALCSVGIAQAAINASVAHVKKRTQFGKFLGEFQMIQEMICDMTTQTDAARLLAYRALSLIQAGKKAEMEASIAKQFATEMAVEVTSKAIQIHGSFALSERHPVSRLFRDARMLTIPDGTTQIQKLIIARSILGLSAFV